MRFPKECDFLAVYGWNPSLYTEVVNWVDDKKRAAFLSLEERESSDPRIQIHVLDSWLQYEGLLKKIAWSAAFRTMAVIGDAEFKETLEAYKMGAELIAAETADWGVKALGNARANQCRYRRGMELKGAFQGIPALIIGAGPSFAQEREEIEKFRDRALIFAGGSALNVMPVAPHFGACIDAHAPYEQFKQHRYSEIPFCYQSRMNRESFSWMKGEKILFPDHSSKSINWIHDEEEFDGGWTVGNFLTAIAVLWGCDPLIFVGMDYCYVDGKKYAGIAHTTSSKLVQRGNFLTQSDWIMAANWTEKMAWGRTFIDTSRQGMLNVPKEPLQKALERCSFQGDLQRRVKEAIEPLSLKEASRWREWDESLHLLKGGVDDGIVHEYLLNPLWQIWRPLFEREMGPHHDLQLHRKIFFQTVLEAHGADLL